jgi:hypothetical protein
VTASEAAASEAATTEVATTEVAATEAAAAEVTAPATEMAAKSKRVGRREHADWSRQGGGSEHSFECLTDHHALRYIAERLIRLGD